MYAVEIQVFLTKCEKFCLSVLFSVTFCFRSFRLESEQDYGLSLNSSDEVVKFESLIKASFQKFNWFSGRAKDRGWTLILPLVIKGSCPTQHCLWVPAYPLKLPSTLASFGGGGNFFGAGGGGVILPLPSITPPPPPPPILPRSTPPPP